MSYQKEKEKVQANLLKNELKILKLVYKFLKENDNSVLVHDIIGEVVSTRGAVDGWKVLAAIDILESSGAIKQTEQGKMTQFNKYEFKY